MFAYDDYQHRDGDAVLEPPMPGVPYLVSEAVGALDGSPTTAGSIPARCWPSRQCCTPRCTTSPGPTRVTPAAWLGRIDYPSYKGGIRIWEGLKTPGVVDTFRAAKPGAAFYGSQRDPSAHPEILPAFFWDFGRSRRPAPARTP